jgi:hypothetical protein
MQTVKLPRRSQVGQGLGGLFSRVFSFVRPLIGTAIKASKPMIKNVLKRAGREGLKAGSEFIGDVLNGENANQPSTSRPRNALKRTFSKTRNDIKTSSMGKKLIQIQRQFAKAKKKKPAKKKQKKKKTYNF